ncbi:MAG: hypothetical protein JXR89_04880 [Deltaproteobacteria bacterium]|nr:hypothetical protein [Deltaproteobacteria bacterium]
MHRYAEKWDRRFKSLLEKHDFTKFARSRYTIYGLWPDYSFAYFNPGWYEFAEKNGGAPTLFEKWDLGSNLMDAVVAELQPFYQDHYSRCLARNQVWEHDYQCSSPTYYRSFRQSVYPVSGQALLIVNALNIEELHAGPATSLDENNMGNYVDRHGFIHQCCHCRKIQHMLDKKRWDWIPAWVEKMPPNTSHGLCPVCFYYYY